MQPLQRLIIQNICFIYFNDTQHNISWKIYQKHHDTKNVAWYKISCWNVSSFFLRCFCMIAMRNKKSLKKVGEEQKTTFYPLIFLWYKNVDTKTHQNCFIGSSDLTSFFIRLQEAQDIRRSHLLDLKFNKI